MTKFLVNPHICDYIEFSDTHNSALFSQARINDQALTYLRNSRTQTETYTYFLQLVDNILVRQDYIQDEKFRFTVILVNWDKDRTRDFRKSA